MHARMCTSTGAWVLRTAWILRREVPLELGCVHAGCA